MKRLTLARKTSTVRSRTVRKKAIPFERHAGLPLAIIDGKFTVDKGNIVHVWRSRAGYPAQWHQCDVMRVAERSVELWDATLGQWFCFDPTSPDVPDVRAG